MKTLHYKAKHIYIGLDTHKFTHTAVIINCWQEKLGEITFNNKPTDYPLLVEAVKKHIKRGITAIFGLEDVGGVGRALAVYLLKNNYKVKEVNSALSASERKSRPIFHKSDAFDAFCIAKSLFGHLEELQDARPDNKYWALSQLVTRREGMVKNLIALKCQLHVQLSHNYPSYSQFFSEIDGKTAIAFWEKYPSVKKLKEDTAEDVYKLLMENGHNFFNIKKAYEIYSLALSEEPDISNEHMDTREYLIEGLVSEIKDRENELQEIEKRIAQILETFDYKLKSMNGIDTVMSAKIIAEVGDISRFPTADKFACYIGIAPVRYSSGNSEKHYKNHQGNRRLYNVFHLLALHQTLQNRNTKEPRNAYFYEYYHKKIKQGKTKGQALICVMRRLSNIIYSMMVKKTEYIPPKEPQKSGK